jgi:signal-transduction protein with cAMP-binding, CBS, and nucleotidyltransferase domain
VVTCSPEASAEDVAATLKHHGVSAVVVIDADGYALGLISRTDLVDATVVQPSRRHWRQLAARHLMSAPVVSVRAETPLGEAGWLIRAWRIHGVVVTVPDLPGV